MTLDTTVVPYLLARYPECRGSAEHVTCVAADWMLWLYTFGDSTVLSWPSLADSVTSKVREYFHYYPNLKTLYISFDSLAPNPVKQAEQAKRAAKRVQTDREAAASASPDFFQGAFVADREWRRRVLFPGLLRVFSTLSLVGLPDSRIIISGLGGSSSSYNESTVVLDVDQIGFAKSTITGTDSVTRTFPEGDLRIIAHIVTHLRAGEQVLLDTVDGDTLTLGLLAIDRLGITNAQLYWHRKNGLIIDLSRLYRNLKHENIDMLSFCCLVFATGNDFVERTPRCTWGKLAQYMHRQFVQQDATKGIYTINADKLSETLRSLGATKRAQVPRELAMEACKCIFFNLLYFLSPVEMFSLDFQKYSLSIVSKSIISATVTGNKQLVFSF